MSMLVVGSVALDSVKTPFGSVKEALGGSAVYFGVAASYFTKVRLVAVIGKDFPSKYFDIFKRHDIDTSGLTRAAGKTFRWKGQYMYDLNQAETLDTKLNVFASFSPKIPDAYKSSKYVFLGNIDPELQLQVVKQVDSPDLIACDTMNFWIEKKPKELKKTLKHVHILVINEGEARQLAGETNIVKAAKCVLSFGPRALVIKRGEYGALFFSKDHIFSAPAYPLEEVFDPTGAGDSFAGGFMGYLARSGSGHPTDLRRAMIFGSVMASFNVEDFSLKKLDNLDWSHIKKRFEHFKHLTNFEMIK